jgi:hypothetical protein
MAGPKKEMSWGTFAIVIFAGAAFFGGGIGGGADGDSTPGNKPKPQYSAVCNEHFKGGC